VLFLNKLFKTYSIVNRINIIYSKNAGLKHLIFKSNSVYEEMEEEGGDCTEYQAPMGATSSKSLRNSNLEPPSPRGIQTSYAILSSVLFSSSFHVRYMTSILLAR
jgi:hypothetical protein